MYSKSPRYNDYQMNRDSKVNPQPNQSSQVNNLYFLNQPPKNKYQYGMFSKRYLPKDNLTSVNRSRASQNNTIMTNPYFGDEKLYSEEMLFLLSEEESNIKYFKEKIDGQKVRIKRDFDNFKRQIEHLIEDLQTSMLAELDLTYKDFINRYKAFKEHMINLRQIRRQLLNELPPDQNDYLSQLNQTKNNPISNRDLLNEIEKDAQLFRTQKIYNQITDLQRQNIVPAKEITAEIIVMGAIETQYYQDGDLCQLFRKIVEIFNRQIMQVYGGIKGNFIKTSSQIISTQIDPRGQNGNILNGLSTYQNYDEYYEEGRSQFKSADHKDIIKMFGNTKKEEEIHTHFNPYPQEKSTEKDKKYHRPVSSSSDFVSVIPISKSSKPSRDDNSEQRRRNPSEFRGPRNYHMGNLKQRPDSNRGGYKVSIDQQCMTADWIEDISMREMIVIEAHQNSDAILCGVFANEGRQLVLGGKDKTLRVYDTQNGKMLFVLSGHSANICYMCNHGSLLSSGGDHGCSSLILWDTKAWSMRFKVQLHSAAVTCIVDLCDGYHLATGSYDKKVNIFNYRKGIVSFTLSSAKAGIACMIISGDHHRLITSSLDKSISIWKITREGNTISNIELERELMNNGLVCTLRSFALKGIYFMAGTKQGKLQIINMMNGETIKRLSAGGGAIVQIVMFERQNKPEHPLVISCCPKEKSMVLTKTETGVNSFIDVKGRLNVDLGCGIGPKIVLSENGLMAIISQSPMLKQVLIYQVGIL